MNRERIAFGHPLHLFQLYPGQPALDIANRFFTFQLIKE